MSDAAPPPWVRRLPKTVSIESANLARAEIVRRRRRLSWKVGEEAAGLLAATMALAQAYERIAQLEAQVES